MLKILPFLISLMSLPCGSVASGRWAVWPVLRIRKPGFWANRLSLFSLQLLRSHRHCASPYFFHQKNRGEKSIFLPYVPYVTGKSQIGLHVGSVSLTFASRCFSSLKGSCLYIMVRLGEPCPSTWRLNQSAFVQSNIRPLCTCGWLQERRNEHTPCPRLAIPGDIGKTYGLFTLLLHLLPVSMP